MQDIDLLWCVCECPLSVPYLWAHNKYTNQSRFLNTSQGNSSKDGNHHFRKTRHTRVRAGAPGFTVDIFVKFVSTHCTATTVDIISRFTAGINSERNVCQAVTTGESYIWIVVRQFHGAISSGNFFINAALAGDKRKEADEEEGGEVSKLHCE